MDRNAFAWPSGKRVIVYHTSWAGYDRKFKVSDIPIDQISDINYAFFDLKEDERGFFVPMTTDAWADFDQRFTDSGVLPYDSWNDDNQGTYGNFGQFLKLKKSGKRFNFGASFNPCDLFIYAGLSIGGWTCSKNFSIAVRTPDARNAFISSIISLTRKYPGLIDTIDLDWEYISPPGKQWGLAENITHASDPDNFSYFLFELRNALDASNQPRTQITACISAVPEKINYLPLQQMSQVLDTINVMTYDFNCSAWGPTKASHQSNLLSGPLATQSVDLAVKTLFGRGVPANKIVIGVPFYSRGFANTRGIGEESNGPSPSKSWEESVVDYKVIPLPGAVEYWDNVHKGAYTYDPNKKELLSFDSVQSVLEKCRYVWDMGLRGIIVWESSGDFHVGHERSLIRALHYGLHDRRM